MFVQWQCKACKGINVTMLGHVNPNTMECEELIGATETDSDENWCSDCEGHTGLESVYDDAPSGEEE
jgi:hypothetical protein